MICSCPYCVNQQIVCEKKVQLTYPLIIRLIIPKADGNVIGILGQMTNKDEYKFAPCVASSRVSHYFSIEKATKDIFLITIQSWNIT